MDFINKKNEATSGPWFIPFDTTLVREADSDISTVIADCTDHPQGEANAKRPWYQKLWRKIRGDKSVLIKGCPFEHSDLVCSCEK